MNIEARTAMCDGVCQHRGRSGSLVALSSCSCLSHPIRQAGLSNHISCHLCLKYFLNIMTNISFPSPWGGGDWRLGTWRVWVWISFAILIQETCKINVYNTLYELNALKINFYNVNCIQCGAIV